MHHRYHDTGFENGEGAVVLEQGALVEGPSLIETGMEMPAAIAERLGWTRCKHVPVARRMTSLGSSTVQPQPIRNVARTMS